MSRVEAIKNILKNSDVLENEALKQYSFTKTGGNADILVRVKSEEDFQNIIKYSNDNDIDLTILGNGSNVLISDTGIRGIVVITSELNTITLSEDNILTCYAGTTLKELADFCFMRYTWKCRWSNIYECWCLWWGNERSCSKSGSIYKKW